MDPAKKSSLFLISKDGKSDVTTKIKFIILFILIKKSKK